MFTGIIDHTGEIVHLEKGDSSIALEIKTQFDEFTLGESISVDGICLTVTGNKKNNFTCELSSETLNVTTAKNFHVGSIVNLEKALRVSDRLGGHFVLGHVDTVAQLSEQKYMNDFLICQFTGTLKKNYLIPKGSIALNGVSLTINEVTDAGFSVMLIPHSLEKTNLSKLKVGDSVNIEYDYLAKIVVVNQAMGG
ncbi:MAG: riboflavin synthase [Proteobacteria bacterium]|nr:riboflavin synthase [Pseudomonadota bacterium]